MNAENLYRLKVAANQFYLNKFMDSPTMTDKEYDQLVIEYEADGGSVKDLIEWEKNERVKNTLLIGLNKVQVTSNNLNEAVGDYRFSNGCRQGYINLKYDGCAVIAFYKNGKLQQIRSTPDEEYGIIRTKSLWNFFPHEISDKNVIALQGEALVDYTAFGKKARNKANGLVNSCNMDDEVERELFIRIYRVYFNDDNGEFDYWRSKDVLDRLPVIKKSRCRAGHDTPIEDIVFTTAQRYLPNQCPESDLVVTQDGNFQCDGAVHYCPHAIKGFKFYYTESAIATVKRIDWSRKYNGSWSATLEFDSILLNDKNIGRCSTGGVPNLMYMKMGVGAKVRVILSNMTIPKVIEVLEPSEDYAWPKCECGYQLSEKDIMGSVLKCGSELCTKNAKEWSVGILNNIRYKCGLDENDDFGIFNYEHALYNNLHHFIVLALQVDRWDPNKTCRATNQDQLKIIARNIWESIMYDDYVQFYKTIESYYGFSGTSYAMFKKNARTSHTAMRMAYKQLMQSD